MVNLTGQQFGNYHLTRHLGTGGFGEVYVGTHIHLRREAAIKLLLKLEPNEIELFRTEAQIISLLIHPQIVTLFDYDVADGRPFIVMMYAEQGTMREHRSPGTPMALAEVVKYITQAADGLQFAHDNHILHRDIKPANMLLGPRGQLLLSDFGLAVMWSGTHSTSGKEIIGTRGYMAPEQYLGQPRPASDQYSLAITAYEWLSGTMPRVDLTLGLGMLQIAHPEIQIPSVRAIVPHLPSRIDDVLRRALASDWQARFPSVREFAEELARAARGSSANNLRVDVPIQNAPPAEQIPLDASFPDLPNSRSTIFWNSAFASITPPDVVVSPNSRSTLLWESAHTPVTPAPADYFPPGHAPPPPPPGNGGYVHFPPYNPLAYPASVTPLYPLTVTPKAPRLLALPVTRAKNPRLTWLWFLGYLGFLLILSLPLLVFSSIYSDVSTQPTWVSLIEVISSILLVPFSTTLAGTLLGKWRGALIPPLFGILLFGLLVVIILLFHPAYSTTTSGVTSGAQTASSSWQDFIDVVAFGIAFCMPPISAFVTGWIYERRRYAHFGKSMLSQLAGFAILIVPLIVAVALIASLTDNTSTPLGTDVLTGCLFSVFILPSAFLASVLEALLHTLVIRVHDMIRARDLKKSKEPEA